MLTLHPESDLRMSTLVLGSEIITILKDHSPIFVERLLNEFLKIDKRRTPEMFTNILLFLFAVGMIEEDSYRIKLVLPQILEDSDAS